MQALATSSAPLPKSRGGLCSVFFITCRIAGAMSQELPTKEPEVDEGDAVGEVAQPEAEPSSFLASFAMPFAAFAGFGAFVEQPSGGKPNSRQAH